MTVEVRLPEGLRLTMPEGVRPREKMRYPTGRLQRGLLLADGAHDLAEEGVGFGVPVLKLGMSTVFPSAADVTVRLQGDACEVEAVFRLDLVERLAAPDGRPVRPAAMYAVKDALAALHRRLPVARGLLTATSAEVRRRFNWVTTYVPVAPVARVPVLTRIASGSGRLDVTARLDGLPPAVTEFALMNEQGARAFARYEEPGGLALEGDAIGTWDEATRQGARFVSRRHDAVFALVSPGAASVHRGRELLGGRLSWAGFGLTVRPPCASFSYTLTVSRLGP